MTETVPGLNLPRTEIAALCRRHQVREPSLFGSALRDDFRPERDIDVLLVFDPDATVGFMAFAGLQFDLADLLGRPVDLVPKRRLKPVIRDEVLAFARVFCSAE